MVRMRGLTKNTLAVIRQLSFGFAEASIGGKSSNGLPEIPVSERHRPNRALHLFLIFNWYLSNALIENLLWSTCF